MRFALITLGSLLGFLAALELLALIVNAIPDWLIAIGFVIGIPAALWKLGHYLLEEAHGR